MRWSGPLTAADRTSPLLTDPAVRELILSRGSTGAVLPLMVEFTGDVTLGQARALVENLGAAVSSEIETINSLLVVLPAARLDELTHLDEVLWVEPPLPALDPLNDCARQATGVDQLQGSGYGLSGSGLTGSGVNLLVYDAGTVDPTHAAFQGRLQVGDTSGMLDHSTHVAGTAAGSGVGSPSGRDLRGMAPEAKVISYGFEVMGGGDGWLYTNPGDIEADWRKARLDYDADLGTASIGTNPADNGFPCEWEGDYGAVSQLLDGIVRGSLTGEPYIATWAAGNERGSFRCGTMYHTTAPPSNAKNPIHVGATYSDTGAITYFSSFGPSDDGRIKPTITAPGCEMGHEGGVNSTWPENQYESQCGTSMSTPVVAGLSALMIQQYRETYFGDMQSSERPLPSTIKAVLIHTAVDRGSPGPDYQYGYGSVDGVAAVAAIQNGDFREDSLSSSGEYLTYLHTVSSGTPELRASLAWDDAPATPNAATQLVNNLDLTLVGPNGQVYTPFVLNPAAPSAAAVTGVDNRNNQEQVIVPNPQPGVWKIRVRAASLPVGPQAYSLVFPGARGSDPGFHLDAAVPGKIFTGMQKVTLALEGSQFSPSAQVRWNDLVLEGVTYTHSSRLQVEVPANLRSSPGWVTITVVNPGGVVSEPLQVEIMTPKEGLPAGDQKIKGVLHSHTGKGQSGKFVGKNSHIW